MLQTSCGKVLSEESDGLRLANAASLEQLRADAQEGGSKWFDPDTLRWFGSRGLALIGSAFTVECQTKAPEGVDRYRVTVWAMREGHAHPLGSCTHKTRRAAIKCAEQTSIAQPEARWAK